MRGVGVEKPVHLCDPGTKHNVPSEALTGPSATHAVYTGIGPSAHCSQCHTGCPESATSRDDRAGAIAGISVPCTAVATDAGDGADDMADMDPALAAISHAAFDSAKTGFFNCRCSKLQRSTDK